MIKQHKYKWLILYYAFLSFLTDKPHEYFERQYGASPKEYKWVVCYECEVGISRAGLRVVKNSFAIVIRSNRILIKEKLDRIVEIIKE